MYLTEHAFSTVVSEDFWSALGNACNRGVPGCEGIAAGMGGAWTRSAGYPVLRVSRRGGRLSISQRPINPANSASSDALWWLPLTIGDSSGAVATATCTGSSTSCTIAVPDALSTEERPVVLNPTGTGLYRVEYDDYADVLAVIGAGLMDRTSPVLQWSWLHCFSRTTATFCSYEPLTCCVSCTTVVAVVFGAWLLLSLRCFCCCLATPRLISKRSRWSD